MTTPPLCEYGSEPEHAPRNPNHSPAAQEGQATEAYQREQDRRRHERLLQVALRFLAVALTPQAKSKARALVALHQAALDNLKVH
jgi:hypothetical protein